MNFFYFIKLKQGLLLKPYSTLLNGLGCLLKWPLPDEFQWVGLGSKSCPEPNPTVTLFKHGKRLMKIVIKVYKHSIYKILYILYIVLFIF